VTQPRANAIVNALQRLDRAGDEASKANEKLKAAAVQVAQHIAAKVGGYAERGFLTLPRGYSLSAHAVKENGPLCLKSDLRGYIFDEEHITAESALHLARDIANGWLEDVTAYLEARTQEAERAAETLREAKLP